MASPDPNYCRPAAFHRFRQELEEIESEGALFRAAFAIALHDRPEADLAEAETIVENLADAVSRRVRSRQPDAILAHLHDVLFDVFQLRGNTEDYYNPANSYLPDVLQTRQGIPISLALVYCRVAEPLGLAVHGVNTPGHFLAEVELCGASGSANSMYVDPFFGGSLLDVDEVRQRVEQTSGRRASAGVENLVRATPQQWLYRMLNNLQASFASSGRERDLYAMQELQTLL